MNYIVICTWLSRREEILHAKATLHGLGLPLKLRETLPCRHWHSAACLLACLLLETGLYASQPRTMLELPTMSVAAIAVLEVLHRDRMRIQSCVELPWLSANQLNLCCNLMRPLKELLRPYPSLSWPRLCDVLKSILIVYLPSSGGRHFA